MKAKVSIIGAGNVGATAAQLIAYEDIADIVLFDIIEGMPQGKALDIMEACPLWESSVKVKGTNNYSDTADSNVVVITSGLPRKPGMSRDDLLHANAEIVKSVAEETSGLSPDSTVIVVSNPMDLMTYIVWKVSGFDPHRVAGMGGVLDSARLRTFVSMELGVSPDDVEAIVFGGHGDQMVLLPSLITVKGIPITKLISEKRVDELIYRTRHGGAEIVSLLKTGSAYYAPAASVLQMVKAIVHNEQRVLSCSAYLDGEYGTSGLFLGVPVIFGEKGIEKIIELELTDGEKAHFNHSAASVKALLDKIKI